MVFGLETALSRLAMFCKLIVLDLLYNFAKHRKAPMCSALPKKRIHTIASLGTQLWASIREK